MDRPDFRSSLSFSNERTVHREAWQNHEPMPRYTENKSKSIDVRGETHRCDQKKQERHDTASESLYESILETRFDARSEAQVGS